MTDFQPIPCLLCGADRPATVHSHSGDPYLVKVGHVAHRVTWVLCRSCGFVYQSPQPSSSLTFRIYAGDYWRADDQGAKRAVKTKCALEQVDWLATCGELPEAGATVLDVGAGDGVLSHTFEARGYKVTRTDVGAPPPADQFSLIVLSHVLEHVHDPDRMLHGLQERLRPGATLFVEVPDVFSLGQSYVLKSLKQNQLAAPHLWSFTPGTLRFLLCRSSFVVVGLEAVRGARGAVLRALCRRDPHAAAAQIALPRRDRSAASLRGYFLYHRLRTSVLLRVQKRAPGVIRVLELRR